MPFCVCVIFGLLLVIPIKIQRGISEIYFSQVQSSRESILKFIGQVYGLNNRQFVELEKLELYIKPKHRYIIEAERKLAVSRGGGHLLDFSYIPATIGHIDGTSAVKLRLKGDNQDQFLTKKLSYRIKMRGNKKFKGMSIFSAHHPRHRNWIHEWVYLDVLRREGIIAPRYYFGELVINGDSHGLYAFEEHFSTELIEYNERREGAIIRLDENIDIPFLTAISSQQDTYFSLPIYLQWPHHLTKYAEKNSFAMMKSEKTNKASIAYRLCSAKLQSYLDGKQPFSKIFDSEKVAKHVAISMIFGATHGLDINNQRFYCNSITGKLEPIGFDGDAGSKILSTKEILLRLNTAVGNFPDEEYLKYLVEALYYYSDPNFLAKLMDDEAFVSNMKNNFSKMAFKEPQQVARLAISNFFTEETGQISGKKDSPVSQNDKEFVGQSLIQKNSEKMYKFLNADGSIISTVTGADESQLSLTLRNVYPLPIKIDAILLNGKNILDQSFILERLPLFSPMRDGVNNTTKLEISIKDKTEFEIFKKDIVDNKELDSGRLQIKYRVNGAPEERSLTKKRFVVEKSLPRIYSFQNHLDVRQARIANITIDNNEKIIRQQGTVELMQNIKIPSGYTYQVAAGSKLIFRNGAFIYSEAPIIAIGTRENPIIFKGEDRSGGGILAIGKDHQSRFQNVEFKSLGNLKPTEGGFLITSALTFYETAVVFKNVSFEDNTSGDDLLNIFRSDFVLHKSKFHNSQADALDIDFSNGLISQTTFSNCGVSLKLNQMKDTVIGSTNSLNGDCIDFSGSRVKLQDITINGAGDKGISVGEASEIQASNIFVKNVKYGVVSKDQSFLEIQNLALHNATVGLASYQKKSEFGPGSIFAQISEASEVDTMSIAENGSIIEGFDTNGIIETKYSTYPFVLE